MYKSVKNDDRDEIDDGRPLSSLPLSVSRALHGCFLEICTVEKSLRTRFTKFVDSFLAC